MRLGQAVFVPFGSRLLQGIVLGQADTPPEQEARPLGALADPQPVLDGPHRALARWLSERYLAPLWECVATCLPAGYGQRSVTVVSPVDVPLLLPSEPVEQRLLQYLAEHGQTALDTLREALGQVPNDLLQRLQGRGQLTVAQGLARPAGRPRMERRVALVAEPEFARRHAQELVERTPRSVAARVLERLAEAHDTTLTEVRELGGTRRHLDELVEGGWLREYEARVERDPIAERLEEPLPPATLTEAQAVVVETIVGAPGEYLLHGVTGSGKTEVYLDLARRTIAAGRGVIVLVPEISLTPQAIRRYGEQFPAETAVLHSGLSTGELYDQWHRIQRGEARVVVGSRSAVFAPVQHLGLVVLDEEHEWTYKQADPQPRYHARDAAAELCRLTGATLVLGSATPDVTTYHRAEVGTLTRLDLSSRVMGLAGGETQTVPLPNITIVDMREELKAGNRGVFSVPLRNGLRRALGRGRAVDPVREQAGGGALPVVSRVRTPPNLSLLRPRHGPRHARPPPPAGVLPPLRGAAARRRRPARSAGAPATAPSGWARSASRRRRGAPSPALAWPAGTATRPAARGATSASCRRWKRARSTSSWGRRCWRRGSDLPAMTVVGVVDADVGLSLPDYVAHERTFQLLSQVAGRAGRRERLGEVYIQTYEPDAPPIRAAAEYDYRGFFAHETQHRRRASYPPFARLARLTYRHANQERGLEHASQVADELRTRRDAAGWPDPDVLGPTPSYVRRLRGEYRWHILLRGHDPRALLEQVTLGRRWRRGCRPGEPSLTVSFPTVLTCALVSSGLPRAPNRARVRMYAASRRPLAQSRPHLPPVKDLTALVWARASTTPPAPRARSSGGRTKCSR